MEHEWIVRCCQKGQDKSVRSKMEEDAAKWPEENVKYH